MFGAPDVSAFAQLADLDDNDDGFITIDDAAFGELAVWRDLDQDGFTDEGELFSLADLDIVSLDATGEALNSETPQGTTLRDKGTFTRGDGSTGNTFEAIFEIDATDTIYRGLAEWLDADTVVDAKGFGHMTDLSVMQSNGFIIQIAA